MRTFIGFQIDIGAVFEYRNDSQDFIVYMKGILGSC